MIVPLRGDGEGRTRGGETTCYYNVAVGGRRAPLGTQGEKKRGDEETSSEKVSCSLKIGMVRCTYGIAPLQESVLSSCSI